MIDLSKKRITLTGGAGFLGRFVEKKLKERGCSNIFIPRTEEYDLRNLDDIVKIYQIAKADTVIHLAAVVGGIGANRENPGRAFKEFGFETKMDFKTGLEKTIEWYIENVKN